METFDYVIAGAGSAGCVLASRLSEDSNVSVLLLEAGPRHGDWRIDMPAAVGRLVSTTDFNWDYRSKPEPGLDNRVLTHPRGRVLGGSSSINGMVYMRGHARDYDGWAQRGARGWSYADVLPYFRRAECASTGHDDYRGGDGLLRVHRPRLPDDTLAAAFVRAGLEAGYPYTEDFNGRSQEGFGAVDRTTDRGRRWSTARAYLDPAMGRKNLQVKTSALALKIVLQGGRANGVTYAWNGGTHTARAAREVLICGGAINSPHLLQLSGIGAPGHLQRAGIPVTHELPGVGENLNDHPDIVIQHHCREPSSIYPATRAPLSWLAALRWLATGTGPAATNHFEAGAFIRSRSGLEHPDLQLTFMPLAVEPGSVNIRAEHAFQVHIDLMRPKSRGHVRTMSPDPRQPPDILFNYLQHTDDVADFIAAVRLTRDVLAQKSIAAMSAGEVFPGPEITSDAALVQWLKHAVETCYHPVGTCRMGAPSDRSAVVDASLRVRGLDGLRVVDASIMPEIVSGNTNAPTIMIAEKAADMILGRQPPPRSAAGPAIAPNWERAQR